VKFILAGIAIVAVAVLVWFFVLDPIRDDIAETEDAIETERNLVVQLETKLKQAESTRAEGKRNQARLLELAKMVPLTEEVPSLLLQIQDLADKSGIEFIQVTPGQPLESDTGAFQIIPLQLGFEGTYFDVSDFVYRAEQMVAGPGRLLAIKGLDLALVGEEGAEAGASPELDVGMTVYAFILGGTAPATGSVAPPGTGDTGTSTTATGSSTGQ
jgi:Tfp pilus assembly protein PilO